MDAVSAMGCWQWSAESSRHRTRRERRQTAYSCRTRSCWHRSVSSWRSAGLCTRTDHHYHPTHCIPHTHFIHQLAPSASSSTAAAAAEKECCQIFQYIVTVADGLPSRRRHLDSLQILPDWLSAFHFIYRKLQTTLSGPSWSVRDQQDSERAA